METSEQSSSSLGELPLDVWVIVREFSDRETLRALRLTSIALEQLARPVLFQSVLLRSNKESLMRALRISETPSLASCVRDLNQYHQFADDHQTLECFISMNETYRLSKPSEPPFGRAAIEHFDVTKDSHQHYDNYLALRSSQAEFQEAWTAHMLHRLITNFTNLAHVRRWDLWMNWTLHVDSGYVQRYGIGCGCCWVSSNFKVQHLLLIKSLTGALGPLRSLEMEWDLSWDIDPLYRTKMFEFNSLQKLQIRIYHTSPETNRNSLSELSQFLQGTTRCVEQLTAGGGHDDQSATGSLRACKLWSVVFSIKWPSLRRLHLSGIWCEEDRLSVFLSSHNDTLKDLCLCNISLHCLGDISESSEPGTRPSVTRLIWSLGYLLDLETFQVTGWMDILSVRELDWNDSPDWNNSLDCWAAHPRVESDCLLSRLLEYICGRSDFPMPELLKYVLPSTWLDMVDDSEALKRNGHPSQLGQVASANSRTETSLSKLIKEDMSHGVPASPFDYFEASTDWRERRVLWNDFNSYSDSSWSYWAEKAGYD